MPTTLNDCDPVANAIITLPINGRHRSTRAGVQMTTSCYATQYKCIPCTVQNQEAGKLSQNAPCTYLNGASCGRPALSMQRFLRRFPFDEPEVGGSGPRAVAAVHTMSFTSSHATYGDTRWHRLAPAISQVQIRVPHCGAMGQMYQGNFNSRSVTCIPYALFIHHQPVHTSQVKNPCSRL